MNFADHTRITAIQIALSLRSESDKSVALLIADADVIHKWINTDPINNGGQSLGGGGQISNFPGQRL